MNEIITWLTGGQELIPEILAIIKLALMFYAYNLVVDLMRLFWKGGKSL